MLTQYLIEHNIHFEQEKSLKEMTTFRIGGNACIVIYPNSAQQASQLISFMVQNKIEYFVMGNGSNLLFSDQSYPIPIIKTDDLIDISYNGDLFTFGSGVKMVNAANFAASHSYSGMEFAHGIPGSIGGAIYMNAGAYDGAMKDIAHQTRYINEKGEICTLIGEEHHFSYRHSFFSGKQCLILDTTLKLNPGDTDAIKAKMMDLMQRRKAKQPLHLPSAGSTFKRPQGAFAGQLIEQCGLRGFTIGGAGVSEKHCGFVVNHNNASFEDVINVIKHVQTTVKEKTGYWLECEVEIIQVGEV